MLDFLEPLLQRDMDILKPTDYNYTISFIGTALTLDDLTISSIRSINVIGEELGRDFEIVVSYRPVAAEAQIKLRNLRKECPNLVFLESSFESHGSGKNISFNYSSGKFIVPFNTRMVYPTVYADVLHNFLKFKLKRLYYSELPLVGRTLISDVGGWRNLSSGEDIDLFSRLSINYGVFACPTNFLQGDDRFHRELLTIRDFPTDADGDFNNSYQLLRDLIISCNHTYSDIRAISKFTRDVEGTNLSTLTFLAYIGSRFHRVKPVSYNRNNYVIFMEAVLESLILREYLKMADVSDHMSWKIDRTHIRFLAARSKMFREMKDSTLFFLKEQM